MVTINDVAKHAGVAISTVSKVLNNYPNVSESTREKILHSIEELHYIPNSIAAALSSKQFDRVAFLLDLNTKTQAIDEISMQYLAGGLNMAKEKNIDVITVFHSMISDMATDELIRYLQSQSITGIIIFGMSKDDLVLHELVKKKIFRCVLVDAPSPNSYTSTVRIDHEQAQYDVAKRTVLDDKCKKILYIAGKKNGYVTEQRLLGMKRLAKELSLTLSVKYGDFRELKARELAFHYAAKYDAVICASDLMAIGAMNALIEMDIFRPVCGFDGITLMGYIGKQMNTVRQDFFRVAQAAVEEMSELLNGKAGHTRILPHKIVKLYYKDIIC